MSPFILCLHVVGTSIVKADYSSPVQRVCSTSMQPIAFLSPARSLLISLKLSGNCETSQAMSSVAASSHSGTRVWGAPGGPCQPGSMHNGWQPALGAPNLIWSNIRPAPSANRCEVRAAPARHRRRWLRTTGGGRGISSRRQIRLLDLVRVACLRLSGSYIDRHCRFPVRRIPS